MRRLLQEISVIPGVTGSCIFDKSDGALCTEFRTDLPVELTENVGIHFVRLIQMGSMNRLSIKSAHFRFDRYTVVGLPLETGSILLAICESDANSSLVATTAAMLAEDMRDELTRSEGEQTVPGEKVMPRGGASRGAGKGVPASLKPLLEEMESALAAAIGPVAGVVMADYIQKWSRSGPAEESRLGALVTMLAEEIGDAGLAKEFRSNIGHLANQG